MRKFLTRRISTLRGFTFFEIAVAVVVTGLIVGVSVPVVINAQRKSDAERMAASVKTLTDANWRLEITGEGNEITKNGSNKWEALDYYVQKSVLADANSVDLEGLVFSNGVWGTTNDPSTHFTKIGGGGDNDGDPNTDGSSPPPVADPNQRVLDLLSQTKIDGKDAPALLGDPEGETVEWVFTDPVTGESRTNKVGRWDPITGKSTSSGDGGDSFSGGVNGGAGYGSGSIPQTISRTNYNEDGTIASVTEETVWTDGPTAESLNCVNATLSVSANPGTRAGVVAGGGNYRIGDLAYIFAAPEMGWKFKRWVRNGASQYTMTSEFPLMQVPIDACKLSFTAEFEPLSGFLSFNREGSGLLSIWTDRGSFPSEPLTSFSSLSETGQKWQITPSAADGHIFRYWQSPLLYKPDFDYSISPDGNLSVTGFRPGETSSFTAHFSKLGDHGEDTSGCVTKTVTGKIYNAVSGVEGGAELGEVIPTGELYKSAKGYFGSIVAEPAVGYVFSHWVIEFVDLSTNKNRVVASTVKSFSLDNINSCSITAKAFFSPKLVTPTPTPVPTVPTSLSYSADPNGTARFFVTGANNGLPSGTVNFSNPGGVRVSVVPQLGYSLKSATALGGTTPLSLTEISLNSFYVNLRGGSNTFLAETELDPDAPVYAGSLTIRARSESGKDAASIEILGVDQTLFTSGANWEKGPTSTIPVYAGQTISVKLAQSSQTSLLQILQSHNFLRVQPTGPDTYDIHILPDQFPGGGLDMYVTFLTSRPAMPAIPADDTFAEDSCTWPITVSIPDGLVDSFDLENNPDYVVLRSLGGYGNEKFVRVRIDSPVPGKEYTFTVKDNSSSVDFAGWNIDSASKAHRYSIAGNVLKVIAGKRTCPEPPAAVDLATLSGVSFSVTQGESSSSRVCSSPLYSLAAPATAVVVPEGQDAANSDNGIYHRSTEVRLFFDGKEVVRNSYIRADGKYRIQPILGAGNTYQWVVQKYTGGGAWLFKRTLSDHSNPLKTSWITPEEFPVCPPPYSEGALYDDGTHDPDIQQPDGTIGGQGLVSIVTRNGANMQWKVVTEKRLDNGETVKVASKSGTLKPNSDITLTIGGDQILEVSAMVSGGVTFLGGKRPFNVLHEKYARFLEFGNYTVSLAPKSNAHIVLTAPTSGDPSQPTPGSSQTPTQSSGGVVIANGSIQLGKILSSADVLMIHGNVGGSWAILPGITRTLASSSLTGGNDRSWPVILALTSDRFQWGDVPGAYYSTDRRIISFAKPLSSENLTVRAVDRSVTPSPSPSQEWGIVRVTSRVSRQPWYFEISGGNSVVGLVGADSPLVLTEPPAGFEPIHYFKDRVGGQLMITRNYDGIVFGSSQNRYTPMLPWPKAGEVLELVVEDLYPDAPPPSPPNTMESPSDPTRGQVALIVSPNDAAGYFHGQDQLSPYIYGTIGSQQTLTARANSGWRLVGLRYSLPGSAMAYTTGLGDSLVFSMPRTGSVTAHFERFVGGSPSPGTVFEPDTSEEEVADIVSAWFDMSEEERIAYGVQKAISQGLPPYLLTPAERAYADAFTVWKFFGWRGLTEAQRMSLPMGVIYNRTDVNGYRLQAGDIKAGYNLSGIRGYERYPDWITKGQNLAGIQFTGGPGSESNHYSFAFSGSNLAGANFAGRQNFWSFGFSGGNLAGVNFARSTSWSHSFGGVNLVGANFAGGSIWNNNFAGANLSGINISGAYLDGWNFAGATGFNIIGGDRDVGAGYSIVNGVLLGSQAVMGGYNLSGVNLLKYNILYPNSGSGNIQIDENTILPDGWAFKDGFFFASGGIVDGGDLRGFNLEGVNLSGMTFRNVKVDDSTKLPEGWSYFNGYLVAPDGRTEVDISGTNVQGLDLSDLNLNGWRGIGLAGTPAALPAGYNIVNGILVGPGVNLAGADLWSMDLRAYDLTGATISRVSNLWSAQLPEGWKLVGGDLAVGPGARLFNYSYNGGNYAGMNLAGMHLGSGNHPFYNSSNLSGANLAGINFGTSTYAFWYANLTGANLAGADMRGAPGYAGSMAGSDFSGIISGGILGEDRDLGLWKLRDGYIYGPRVNLSGANLAGVNLLQYNLVGANFGGGNVIIDENTKIPDGWTYSDGYFFGPNISLRGANLAGVNLQAFNLSGMSFSNITIDENTKLPEGWTYLGGSLISSEGGVRVDLSGVNLEGVNLAGYNMFGWTGSGISGTPLGLPDDYAIVNGILVGPGVSIEYISLSGVNLSSYNLYGARVAGVTSLTNEQMPSEWAVFSYWDNGATRHAAIGPGANIAGVPSIGNGAISPEDNFTGSNISGVQFWGVEFVGNDMSGANLAGARYWSTKFDGVDLSGVNFANVSEWSNTYYGVQSGGVLGGDRTLSGNWSVRNGYILGPGVNLAGENLTGVSLSGINFFGANFRDAVVNPATLPDSLKIANGQVVGPGFNLTGYNMAGVNFAGGGVNIAGANLAGANLVGANLMIGGLPTFIPNVIADETTVLPAGYVYENGSIIRTVSLGYVEGGDFFAGSKASSTPLAVDYNGNTALSFRQDTYIQSDYKVDLDNGFTMFYVARDTGPGNGSWSGKNEPWALAAEYQGRNYEIVGLIENNLIAWNPRGLTFGPVASNVYPSDGQMAITEFSFAGGDPSGMRGVSYSINGTSGSTNIGSHSHGGSTYVDGKTTVGYYGDGNVNNFQFGEWLVFNRPLTTEEKATVNSYLAAKWRGGPDEGVTEADIARIGGVGLWIDGNSFDAPSKVPTGQALTSEGPSPVSANGNVLSYDSVKKFGEGSFYFPSGSSYLSLPSYDGVADFGTGDFTIEFWFKKGGTPDSWARVFQTRDGDLHSGIGIFFEGSSDTLAFYSSAAGSNWDVNSAKLGTVSSTDWRHFAVVRQGSTVRCYQDGVLQSTTSIGNVYHNPNDIMIIGGQGGTSRSVNGFIDDFRITKGVARYTGSFTPPAEPMSLSSDPYASNVSLLLNMD